MTPNKKIVRWCISMYHVTSLKETCSIKNIMKVKKKIVDVVVYWEE